ncbi:MAG: DUF952 domain-containing protein [Anaerolineales bacterium]
MSDIVLHITSRSAWQAARMAGFYAADSLEGQGFIHCSLPSQVLRVANNLFRGRDDLVLLVIDPARLTAPLKWEPAADLATEIFPHLYGPLNLEAVVDVLPLGRDAAGGFLLPPGLNI